MRWTFFTHSNCTFLHKLSVFIFLYLDFYELWSWPNIFLVPTEEITAAPRPPEDKLSEGKLAGIIVVALVVAVMSAVVIAVFLRNRRNSNDKKYGYVIQKLGSENWFEMIVIF